MRSSIQNERILIYIDHDRENFVNRFFLKAWDVRIAFFCGVLIFLDIIISRKRSPIGYLPYLFAWIWLILTGPTIITWKKLISQQSQNFWREWHAHRYSQYVLIAGGFFYIGAIIGRLIFLKNHYGWNPPKFSTHAIIISFLIVIYSSITEEIFFRKTFIYVLLNSTNSKYVAIVSVFAQSLIWTVVHYQYYNSLTNLVMIFGLGLYFGALFIYTHKVWWNIIFHVLNNILSLIAFFYL